MGKQTYEGLRLLNLSDAERERAVAMTRHNDAAIARMRQQLGDGEGDEKLDDAGLRRKLAAIRTDFDAMARLDVRNRGALKAALQAVGDSLHGLADTISTTEAPPLPEAPWEQETRGFRGHDGNR